MPIMEAYWSIQGEGPLLGAWVYFIRLVGCNRHCHDCDTPKSRTIRGSSPTRPLDSLWAELPFADRPFWVVITGGEPFIDVEYLDRICSELRHRYPNVKIQIESNGDLVTRKTLETIHPEICVISPKTEDGVRNAAATYEVSPALKEVFSEAAKYDAGYPQVVLKFAIDVRPEAIATLRHLADQIRPTVRVYLMPWTSMVEQQLPSRNTSNPHFRSSQLRVCSDLVEILKLDPAGFANFHVAPRLHNLLWGPKEGV